MRYPIIVSLVSILLPAPAQAQQARLTYDVRNVAGSGTPIFLAEDGTTSVGDGAAAVNSAINNPMGIAIDSSGNLIVADAYNNRIRRVSSDGNITTIAGTGGFGFSGDDAAATSAQIYHPTGIAIDGSGTIYFADSFNHIVRRFTVGGNITRFAGTGASGYNGDGQAANASQLSTPIGIALDSSGNLYIADTANHLIRKVTSSGTISTVAGRGFAGFSGDGAVATEASLNYPQAVIVDSVGNLYIADTYNDRIRKVTTDGIITTIAGNGIAGYSGDGGPALEASLNYPKGLALDPEGNLYIVDCFNGRVRKVDTLGRISTIAGTGTMGYRGDGGPAGAAQFRFPSWIARTSSGNLYISDTQNNRVRLLTPGPFDPSLLPSISNAGVITSTAFGGFPAIAPGSWIEIYGSNLAGGTRGWSGGDFRAARAPTSLDGTQVLIGGLAAYVAFISPNQVNALVPFTAGLGEQQVRVTTSLGTSAPYEITVNPTQPGLLAPPLFRIGETQYAAAVFADGATYALPAGAISGLASRPARPGDSITFYGVGFGPVNPFLEAGAIVQRSNTLELPVEISIGAAPAVVTYQGLAPGGVGLYQFNVTVPQGAAGAAVPVAFRQGSLTSSQTLYIAVVD